MKSYHLNLPSLTTSIMRVEPFIRDIKELHILTPDRYHDMLVAITEAVNNAIIHGNGLDPEKPVTIDVSATAHKATIIIRDAGQGFNPNNVPDPRLPENLMREGGRGVFLIRHLADDVEFVVSGPGMSVILKYFY